MAPYEIRKAAGRQLREIFLKMASPEWDLIMMGKPKEVKDEAARVFARVQSARLRLGNAVLADIRDKLRENEDILRTGRQRVAAALENLNRVRQVLNTVTSLVDTVGRIVSLV